MSKLYSINRATLLDSFDVYRGMICRIHTSAIPEDSHRVGDVIFYRGLEFTLIAPPVDDKELLWIALCIHSTNSDKTDSRFAKRSPARRDS